MNVRADQLIKVLVSRNDDRLEPLLRSLTGQRANDVICLVAVELYHGVIEALDDLPDPAETVSQVVRHLLTGRLVLRVYLVTEGITRVENDREVVGLKLLPDVQQEAREPERSRRVLPRGVSEGSIDERKIRAINQRVCVDQEDARTGLRRDLQRSGSRQFWGGRHRNLPVRSRAGDPAVQGLPTPRRRPGQTLREERPEATARASQNPEGAAERSVRRALRVLPVDPSRIRESRTPRHLLRSTF